MIVFYNIIILPIIVVVIIPFLLQIVGFLGTITAVKLCGGRITNFDFGSGRIILKIRCLQIRINLLGGYEWNMSGIKRSNRIANIFIQASAGLTSILLGLLLWNLQAKGIIKISALLVIFIGYNFIHAARCLLPYTSDDVNSHGLRIWHFIRYGYSDLSSEYNKKMKLYVLNMKAWDLIVEKDFEKALSLINTIPDIKEQFPIALYCRARIYMEYERYDDALQDYFDYIYFNPNNASVYSYIAHIYNELGEKEKYLKYNLEALKLNPNYMSVINNIADCYNDMGNYDEALSYATQGLKINPKYDILYCTLAETHLFLNNMDKFYENIKLALKHGYTKEQIYDNKNLKTMLDDPQLKAILGSVN